MFRQNIGIRSSSTSGRFPELQWQKTYEKSFVPSPEGFQCHISIHISPTTSRWQADTYQVQQFGVAVVCVRRCVFFWNRTSMDPEFGCVTGAPPVGPSVLKNNRLIKSLGIGIIYENPWARGGIKECKSVVILRDFHWIVHCLGQGFHMTWPLDTQNWWALEEVTPPWNMVTFFGCTLVFPNMAMENGPEMKMIFLLNMVIFQPAMLVSQTGIYC